MAQQVRPIYKCTQVAFYEAGRLLVQNLEDNLTEFTLHSLSYDDPFIIALRQEITDAEALPDVQQRGEDSQVMRIQLQPLAKKCLNNWQKLKLSYIQKAFPEAEWEARWQSAGANYYTKASHENWENLKQLNESGAAFISAKTFALLANNNMPAGFQAQYTADALAYKNLYDSFLPAQETTPATNAKITANNNLYKKFKLIDDDGKVIYIDDGAMQDLFTWTKVLEIVAPKGSASLKVAAIDKLTLLPIAGVEVTIELEGKPDLKNITDETGIVVFKNIDPGVYKVGWVKVGYLNETITKEVNAGTEARLEVLLTASV